MKDLRIAGRQKAFALVITLALLALLVLAVYALSALTRVGSQIAGTGVYRVQARQNAQLGLTFALSQLQLYAGPDKSLTGTADIVPSTKAVNSRWTGVWLENDQTPRWLVSGTVDPAVYEPGFGFGPDIANEGRKVLPDSPADIVLVGNGSTNTSTSTDRYFPGDAVIVPRVPIPAYNAAGALSPHGYYAFWVGDEGVKLSAALPAENPPGAPAATRHAIGELPGGWTPNAAPVLKALAYEQMAGNAGPGITGLRNTFHGVTLVHLGYLNYPTRRAGLININSAGTRLWRGVMGTYDPGKSADAKRIFAAAIGDKTKIWGPAGADKLANGPFTTVPGFLDFNTEVMVAIADTSADYNAFKDALRPWFTVRSDTFRIRAYGDAVNPADATKVEATAYCEAIVQRVKDSGADNGRFVITYFRWLGPEDI